MAKSRWLRWVAIAIVVALLSIGVHRCLSGPDLSEIDPGEEIEAELTLQTVTLEQPDENGDLMWRIKAQSVNYRPDDQKANLSNIEGEFFQDGDIVYTVTANEGEVQQNGETLFLRGDLIANSKADELTIEGEQLKWQPKSDLLVMGNFDEKVTAQPFEDETPSAVKLPSETDKVPVHGFNPQMEAFAEVAQVSSKENRVELTGGVLAKSKESPWLTFESEALLWLTKNQVIEAKRPLKVEQYNSEAYQKVTDRLIGQKGQVALANNIVTLSESVKLDSLTQPLKVNSERAVWDIPSQQVSLDKPVEIEQPEDKIRASANSAQLNLAEKIVYLIGNVKATGEKNNARLSADTVTWQTATQQIEAEGNVSYQQAESPEFSMTGPYAVGNIEAGTIVVTGGETGEVVTEIVPENP